MEAEVTTEKVKYKGLWWRGLLAFFFLSEFVYQVSPFIYQTDAHKISRNFVQSYFFGQPSHQEIESVVEAVYSKDMSADKFTAAMSSAGYSSSETAKHADKKLLEKDEVTSVLLLRRKVFYWVNFYSPSYYIELYLKGDELKKVHIAMRDK